VCTPDIVGSHLPRMLHAEVHAHSQQLRSCNAEKQLLTWVRCGMRSPTAGAHCRKNDSQLWKCSRLLGVVRHQHGTLVHKDPCTITVSCMLPERQSWTKPKAAGPQGSLYDHGVLHVA